MKIITTTIIIIIKMMLIIIIIIIMKMMLITIIIIIIIIKMLIILIIIIIIIIKMMLIIIIIIIIIIITMKMEGRKEGNVSFNDALNTFYLQLYGVRYMVKDHSDSERGNPLPPPGLLFLINSKGSFICTIQQTG